MDKIDYRRILSEDFKSLRFSKDIIIPNKEGFITEALLKRFNFQESQTTLLNFGTGQGKTTAIYKLIKNYVDQGHTVIVAPPTISLISKYAEEIEKFGVDKSSIFDYRNLGKHAVKNKTYDALLKPIQLITVNSFLGNPGELYPKQSQIKRKYLEDLAAHLKSKNKKIVLIFDEFHAASKSFTELLLPNLNLFHNLIHSTIFSSATFSETSIINIKNYSKCHEHNIQLYESPRLSTNKNTKLHLFMSMQPYSKNNLIALRFLLPILKELNSCGRIYNIISYSEGLAKSLCGENNPKNKLEQSFKEVLEDSKYEYQLVTSKTDKTFKDNFINIGTTFTNGINMNDPNSVLITIMPPFSNIMDKQRGIFNDGVNVITQTVGRLRNGGDAIFIMPLPKELIHDSDVNYKIFNSIAELELVNSTEQNYSLNDLPGILKKEFFDNYKRREKGAFETPTLEKYVIEREEKLKSANYISFGKDLNAWVLHRSLSNQFRNAEVVSIQVKNKIKKKDIALVGKVMEDTISLMNSLLNEESKEPAELEWLLNEKFKDYTHIQQINIIQNHLKTNFRILNKDRKVIGNKTLWKYTLAIVWFIRNKIKVGTPNTLKNFSIDVYLNNNIDFVKFISKEPKLRILLDNKSIKLLESYIELNLIKIEFKERIKRLKKIFVSKPTNLELTDLCLRFNKIVSSLKLDPALKFKVYNLKELSSHNPKSQEFLYSFLLSLCIYGNDKSRSGNRYYYKTLDWIPNRNGRECLNLIFEELEENHIYFGLIKDKSSKYTATTWKYPDAVIN